MLELIAGVLGSIVALLIVIAIIVNKCYRKVEQGRALIINKLNKEPYVAFTGGLVLPVVHKAEVMDISVKTITVDRRGKEGLICEDNVRADIAVAFFVRVNDTQSDVLTVAKAVGVRRASDRDTLEELFQAKFSEALKTVGKQMDFVDLYNERQSFKESIQRVIGRDLNGYNLEDVAIDYLEQTPIEALDADNILDAQGIRKIIDLTNEQKVAANAIQKEADKTIKKQNVEAQEAILALERQEADAVAVQKREIAIVQARETAEIEKAKAEEGRRAEEARLAAEQEVGVARENTQREVEIAGKNRERAVLVEAERVEKERQLEVVGRERATDLARIEKEKALEGEKKAIADVVRERVAVDKTVAQEEERIKDLRATMEADRVKQVALTKANEQAEELKIKELAMAEAAERAAAHNAKEKLVLAEAEQAAAEKEALAAIRRAEGAQATAAASGLALAKVREADATAAEREGLARVHVEDAEVVVVEKRARIEAEAIELKMFAEAKGIAEKAESMQALNDSGKEHEEFRLKLEQQLAITKEQINAQVQIAERNAQTLATALSNAKFDIVGGDGAFFDRFVKAVSFGKSIDGAIEHSGALSTATSEYLEGDRSLPDDIKEVLTNSRFDAADLKNLAASGVLAKIAKGKDPAQVQALLEKAKELGFGDNLTGFLQGDS